MDDYAVEILQREYLNTRATIRKLRVMSNECQHDFVGDEYPKREARLTCSCGKRAYLYNRQKGKEPVSYAYMCECGVKGYVGLSKEEAFFGWELRGNKSAYMDYILAKQMKIKK